MRREAQLAAAVMAFATAMILAAGWLFASALTRQALATAQVIYIEQPILAPQVIIISRQVERVVTQTPGPTETAMAISTPQPVVQIVQASELQPSATSAPPTDWVWQFTPRKPGRLIYPSGYQPNCRGGG